MNDEELQACFENQSILNDAFSHEKHICISFVYLCQNSFAQGLELIIDAIKKLNVANAVHVVKQHSGFDQT